jgi:hypothetical protein
MGRSVLFNYDSKSIWTLSGELLGQTFETTIDGVAAKLHLPRAEEGTAFPQALMLPKVLEEVTPKNSTETRVFHAWGRPTELELLTHSVLAADIYSFVIEVGELELSGIKPLDWARPGLDEWSNTLTQWIEFFGSQISSRQAREAQAAVKDNIEIWMKSDEKVEGPSRNVEVNCSVPLGGSDWGSKIKREKFELALAKTSIGKQVPIEHVFIATSSNAFMLKEYRKTILDASIAIEIVLRREVKKKFGELTTIQMAPKRFKPAEKLTLGELLGVVSEFSESWPKSLSSEIANVRNRAAHYSDKISRDTAQAFLSDAQLITSIFDNFEIKEADD